MQRDCPLRPSVCPMTGIIKCENKKNALSSRRDGYNHNPYKHNVLCVGHRQTVQTRPRSGSPNVLLKFEKLKNTTHLHRCIGVESGH